MPPSASTPGFAERAVSFGETPTPRAPAWKLEDAKARFSEVVRRARSDGPQLVTVRGKAAVVVISAEEFERLAPADPARPSFVAFMEGLGLQGLDLTRPRDTGRDVNL